MNRLKIEGIYKARLLVGWVSVCVLRGSRVQLLINGSYQKDRSGCQEILELKSLIGKALFCSFHLSQLIWKALPATKTKGFGRLLTLGKLNTQDLLQRRRLCQSISPRRCKLCSKNKNKK